MTLTGLLFAGFLGAAGGTANAVPPAPPNPSDQQIDDASAAQAQVADQVKTLSAQVTQAQTQLEQVQSEAQLAQELYNKALVDLQMAQQNAEQTAIAVDQAQVNVETAAQDVNDLARASYIHGTGINEASAFLYADGPAQLIEQAGFLDAISDSQIAVLDELQVAKVQQANADSAAKQAVLDKQEAEAAADEAKAVAQQKLAASKSAVAQLSQQKSTSEAQLSAAQASLADLQGQREQFNQWQAQKQAEEEAAAAAAAAAAAQAAAAAAAAAASQDDWTESDSSFYTPPLTSYGDGGWDAGYSDGGGWSAEKGQIAVNAALEWLGTPYSWGGGDASGPTMGIPDGGVADSYGDYAKVGFDCSGLVTYAWARAGILMGHYTGYQVVAGQFVPYEEAMPGDMLFWGSSVGSTHHVALYMGDGMMVEAPQSGSYVKVSPVRFGGFLGVVRPGT